MPTAALPVECTAWLAKVDRVMKRDWCIDSNDAGWSSEETLRYWRYGESPEAFVTWFAEKYGLIRATGHFEVETSAGGEVATDGKKRLR